MDHTANAVTPGGTSKYIGHDRNFHWEERLHLESEDAFGLQPLDARELKNERQRKVSTLRIDKCLQHPENAHFQRFQVPHHAVTVAIAKAEVRIPPDI